MERISIDKLIQNHELVVKEDGHFKIDPNDYDSLDLIHVLSCVKADFLFASINLSKTIKILVDDSATCTIKGLINGKDQNIEIHSENGKNSSLSLSFIDFSQGKSNITVYAKTEKEGAEFNWNMASLSAHKDNKKVVVNLDHNAENLLGNVSNYGVCKDEGKLLVAGISHIKRGSKKTTTHQNAKIMLIDKSSNGIAKPILKIDEDDVIATHGASLGQVNEEHLFYLKSRGLTEAEAKRLVILGYFNPIMLLFKDEECEEEILSLVEERV